MGTIRVGIGGWSYPPWRDNFYPQGLPQNRELDYASRQLDVIEINNTFHRSQTPSTFAKWRDETPDGFVFSVKASRFTTIRRVLADSGNAVAGFLGSGVVELGAKLGPIVWRFAPTKAFEAEDFEAFLKLLPETLNGLPLSHALDVRHPSFRCAQFLDLARRYRATTVYSDAEDSPKIAEVTGDFAYARIVVANGTLARGFKTAEIDRHAQWARVWRDGSLPAELPRVATEPPGDADPAIPAGSRDVFMFYINGAKEKAPAAAMALKKRLPVV